jgi:geranylgeranyl reductase
LRKRAELFGATVKRGKCVSIDREKGNTMRIQFRPSRSDSDESASSKSGAERTFFARAVIGADGANSMVAKKFVPGGDKIPYVAAYHEIVETPKENFDGTRCDVWYQGRISPDFYGWVFPHGDKTSVGLGSANKGFSLKSATKELRKSANLDDAKTVRCEGAPIPLKPLKRWDDGSNVLLAGDAAGIVAPSSGEGIYYAMVGGKLAAEAVGEFLKTGDAKALKLARKRFMKAHGKVFWVLGMMQKFWYSSDARRERFVSICRDPDVQHLTWQAYMHKKLVKAKPAAHARIFFKDLAHLLGVVKP